MSRRFRSVAILAIAMTVATSVVSSVQAAATPFLFDPDGAGGAGAVNVTSLDWLPGNTLAVGGNASVMKYLASVGAVNDPFENYTQARLGNATLLGGGTANFVGLNAAYEITVVVGTTSVISAAAPGFVSFTAAAPAAGVNFIEIYASAANASDLGGTGFNDGTLILRATIGAGFGSEFATFGSIPPAFVPPPLLDQFLAQDYPGQRTVVGTGGVAINGSVVSAHASFFPNLPIGSSITMNFNGTLIDPYAQTDPSGKFLLGAVAAGSAVGVVPTTAGAGLPLGSGMGSLVPGAGIGTVNGDTIAGFLFPGFTGLGGPDFQFQTDAPASMEFQLAAVPEPMSLLIWGATAVCAFGIRSGRRSRRS